MENYVRFSSSSPPASTSINNHTHSPGPFLHHSPSTGSEGGYLDSPLPPRRGSGDNAAGGRAGGGSDWSFAPLAPLQRVWQRWCGAAQQQDAYRSGYLTLVPLSDSRLKPRRTKLIVSTLLLLALLAVTGVFVLVPRGVSVGTIEVHSTRMTFNSTTHTYRIILEAEVPIYNPNYLKASVEGNLTVSFYDAEAGWNSTGSVVLSPRANPQVLDVSVDASNLPRKYTQVVYNSCFTFPEKLIFFLLGTFQTTYLGYTTALPSIDTYFVLDCSNAKND